MVSVCATGFVTGSPLNVKAAFEMTRLAEAGFAAGGFTAIVTFNSSGGLLLSCQLNLICPVYAFGGRLLRSTVMTTPSLPAKLPLEGLSFNQGESLLACQFTLPPPAFVSVILLFETTLALFSPRSTE